MSEISRGSLSESPAKLTDTQRLDWMIEHNGLIGKNAEGFPQVEWVMAWFDDKEKIVECFPNCSARQAIDAAIDLQRESDGLEVAVRG